MARSPDRDAPPAASSAWNLVRALGLLACCFTLASLARVLLPALADPSATPLNDWIVFQRAAERASTGPAAEVYAQALREDYPFAYPPIVLAALSLLGGLAPGHFFALLTLASLLALTLAGVVFARALCGGPREAREGAWLASAGSACASVTLVAGQAAAFHLLAAALGGALWLRGRSVAAGAVLALLALKPPLALGVPLVLLATRDLRALGGFAVGLAALAGGSFAMGRAAWSAWLDTLGAMGALLAEQHVQLAKNVGLRAFVELQLAGLAPAVRTASWLAAAVTLACGAGCVWWRAPRSGRTFGQALLFTAAATPYLFLYDGLLLALPFLAFAVGGASYGSPTLRRALGACWACLYVELFIVYLAPGAPPRTGLWIAAILALELVDGARGPSRGDAPSATLCAA